MFVLSKNYLKTFIYIFIIVGVGKAQVNVSTQHNDNNRTGWYKNETVLNQKNVKPGLFGKLFSREVDDQIYAQPLVIFGVNLQNVGKKNLLIVATVNNTVYAFDADTAKTTAPYWQINLSPIGSRAVKNTDMTGACGGGYQDFSGNMGIVGTPVVDSTSNTLYVVVRYVRNNIYAQDLVAIDITTGIQKTNSPKRITATVKGYGDGNRGGIITFDARKQNQRCGLLLLNGVIYITWASHCDWGPYHGWILGYDKNDLSQKIVYNNTPEGYNGGIWMSGAGPAADENGNIYVSVGNGSVGRNGNPSDVINRSESALKLTPNATTLNVASFFTPKNYLELEAADLDFGVTQIMLIPGTNQAITGCKDGRIYLLNRDNMGGYNSQSNRVAQTITLASNATLRSSFGYYRGQNKEYVYSWSENALLKSFPYSRTLNKFDLANTISSGVQGPTGSSGAVLSVSSNASVDSTAILWASYAANGDAIHSVRPGILRAFDANNVTREIWNSSQNKADSVDTYAKFNCPTVANGKVYLATFSKKVLVYGLVKGSVIDTCNTPNIGLGKTASATSYTANNAPSRISDGDYATAWINQDNANQYVSLDLGMRYNLCRIAIHWQNPISRDFALQVSDDSFAWRTLSDIKSNSDLSNYFISNTTTARYIRMLARSVPTQNNFALTELEAYGTVSAQQCPTPDGIYTNNVFENIAKINWQKNGASSFKVRYKTVSAISWSEYATGDVQELNIDALTCGTDYLYQVKAVCQIGQESLYSASKGFSTLSCNSNCGLLPTRFNTQDIGPVKTAGRACFSNEIFSVSGGGYDSDGRIEGARKDAIRYTYKTFVGDGEIICRVTYVYPQNNWSRCGLMFRESLTDDSRNVFLSLSAGNGACLQNRSSTGVLTTTTTKNVGTYPLWLKLVKMGTTYTAYTSPDGIKYTPFSTTPLTIDFGSDATPIYAGIAVTSNSQFSATNTVDNFSVTEGTLPLKLLSFAANLSLKNTVNLKWVTTLENGVKSFTIETSKDGFTYTDIYTTEATNGGDFTKVYKYEDKLATFGSNYYRLRMTDLDGTTTFSALASINLGKEDVPTLSPNPANGYVNVGQGSEKITMVIIRDVLGRELLAHNNLKKSSRIVLPVSGLANGMYIVEIKTPTREYIEKLIIKN